MRYIDDIIRVVNEHPYISPTHKKVLINRIEKEPTREELDEVSKPLTPPVANANLDT